MNELENSDIFDADEHPHTRYNPLGDEWILVSPHRTKRPWKGKIEESKSDDVPKHDPNNPLCPGSTRSNGEVRRKFWTLF